MRALITAFCLLASLSLARAEGMSVDFNDQRYHLNYEDAATLPDGSPGDGLAEFTLKGETVNDWTKLFAFHAYPEAGDDPSLAAATLGKLAKETNKDANFALMDNPKQGDAIVDFLTWAPNSDVMEFNVFKYARAQNGPGLVALQYAQRFKLGDMDVDDFRALRQRAVEEMAATDMGPARSYFAAKKKEQLGSAADSDQSTTAGYDR